MTNTEIEIIGLIALVVGWANGLMLGWVLWSKPQLKYQTRGKHD